MAASVGVVPSGVAAFALAGIHLFASRAVAADPIPRSPFLSLGGGVSVAYVFVHVLPELSAGAAPIRRNWPVASFVEHHVYLVALAGFVLYYGLENLAKRARPREEDADDRSNAATGGGVFWVHLTSFGVYNALVGYLLVHREEPGAVSLLLFAAALGLHFIVNDHGLHDHFERRYRDRGRWLLAGAIIAGWVVGVFVDVSRPVLDVLFAFLAGGIVLNVIKEELPAERESRFSAFLLGAVVYAAIVLAA